ncbi:MAG TPA: aminotransferase class I/II-fold pyridoxal phosphate-dependent enzyme [Candidatus Baltobacteraceae bacterium]|nr:aminotransferase class I/II-fold pyridoxal phosphate-dependent enzyme [Candidatus Baltobacteraceae bacterium]
MNHEDGFGEDFARVGRWIEDYLAHPERYPVLPSVKPGEIAARLPDTAPEEGEPFEAILADFDSIIVPGITHWNHPRFFAYFATSAAPAAIAAEALVAALDVKVMLWRTSPSAAELESVVMRWLGTLMGVPESWTGIIYDTASVAGFTALAAAREALGLAIRERGLSGRDLPALRVYATEHTHSHIEKAAIALGIGCENVVKVACDDAFRMDPNALESEIAADIAAGRKPMAVVATVGTTSMTSVDPVARIAEVAKKHDLWLHVDAAYAGVAAILPEFASLMDGVDRADSLVVNPHKWMFVPMDLSVLFLRDESTVRRAFSLVPEYLTTTDGDVRNYMDYGLQLGRRFRALKLWFVLRHLGAKTIREKLRDHIALAQRFAQWVRDERDWEVLAPHPFSVVCFRFHPEGVDDERELERLNAELLEAVNATGEMFISHTKIDGSYALRLAIGNLRTTQADVEAAWGILGETAAKVFAHQVTS